LAFLAPDAGLDVVTGVGAQTHIRRRPCPDALLTCNGAEHPLLRRLYAARAVQTPEELALGLDRLLPATLLLGMDRAVAILSEAVVEGRRLLVVGDFDADGATSCAVAVRALRALGAVHVDYLVPNRFEYGYGLTPEIVEVAAERRPDVLITVDNGISSLAGVRAAQALGIRVVVTDHHLAGAQLPGADAIVNPNQPGDGFPSKCLAGVGVIFYVVLALRAHLRTAGWFERTGRPEPNLARFLDLVALGTVADVVPLDANNRVLVDQGIRRIRARACCPGILALLEAARRQPERLTASDLGFAIGPRLNAAGRLEDMSLGIECLLSDDPAAARSMAARLDELNRERRQIEQTMRLQAEQAVAALALPEQGEALPAALCLYDPGWHQGVIGILASRIKEQWHRPVIAFAPAGGGELKGSARSIPGLHIRDALDAVAARHPALLSRFGGHAMAAGLSLAEADLPAFRAALAEHVQAQLTPEDLTGVVWSDGALDECHLDLHTAELLREAGPWGQGFPEPVFDGVFEVVSSRVVGERHRKLQVRPRGGSCCLEAIAFNTVDPDHPSEVAGAVRLAYRLDVNEYRGLCRAQLVVEHLEPVAD